MKIDGNKKNAVQGQRLNIGNRHAQQSDKITNIIRTTQQK